MLVSEPHILAAAAVAAAHTHTLPPTPNQALPTCSTVASTQ